jgi:hypothetical protein
MAEWRIWWHTTFPLRACGGNDDDGADGPLAAEPIWMKQNRLCLLWINARFVYLKWSSNSDVQADTIQMKPLGKY